MAKKKNLTIDTLWKLERAGAPSLAPDGAQAVCTLSSYSMQDNRSRSTLWLLSTLGGKARALTHCGDKDAQPQWSPKGDLIAFVAKREQQGKKDETPQLYVIAPDGGEARRVSDYAPGIEAFKWFPDGKRIAFLTWVWPGEQGNKAQARRMKAFKERKETGYATSEAYYRYWDHFVPMGRVPHLHVMDISTGRVRDLFEGSPYELARGEPDLLCFDVSPDGRKAVFAHDPAERKRCDGRFALCEVDLRNGRFTPVAQDPEWDFSAPRYNADASSIAFIASHQARA